MEIIASLNGAIGLSEKGVRLRSVNSAWYDVCKALFNIGEVALTAQYMKRDLKEQAVEGRGYAILRNITYERGGRIYQSPGAVQKLF